MWHDYIKIVELRCRLRDAGRRGAGIIDKKDMTVVCVCVYAFSPGMYMERYGYRTTTKGRGRCRGNWIEWTSFKDHLLA